MCSWLSCFSLLCELFSKFSFLDRRRGVGVRLTSKVKFSGIFFDEMSRASTGRGRCLRRLVNSVSPGPFFETRRQKFFGSTFTLTDEPGNSFLILSTVCFMHSLRMVGYGVEHCTPHFSLRIFSTLERVSRSLKS